jgi:hypothetical protein
MNRFALAALMIMTAFSSANAGRINSPTAFPECIEDARRLCSNVLEDTDKRRACMRAHRAQLSQECIAAVKRGMSK